MHVSMAKPRCPCLRHGLAFDTRSYATSNFGIAGAPYPARPADSITLTAHGKQVRLTETHKAIERVTRAIEAVLPPRNSPGARGVSTRGDDAIRVEPEPFVTEPATASGLPRLEPRGGARVAVAE